MPSTAAVIDELSHMRQQPGENLHVISISGRNFTGGALRSCLNTKTTEVTAEVICTTDMKGKFQVQPGPIFLRDNPNVYCKPLVYDMTSVGDQTE